MAVFVILFICSVAVAGGFLVAFVISTRKGQYDDLETPKYRMFDNES